MIGAGALVLVAPAAQQFANLPALGEIRHADGDGYYIRDGVIIVPKDGVIKPGTIV